MLRDRVEKASSLSHYNSPNVLSVHALIGAYRPEGYQWVDELREVLKSNADYAYNYILRAFQGREAFQTRRNVHAVPRLRRVVQGA